MENISRKKGKILWGIFIFTIVIGIINMISGPLSLLENPPLYFLTLSLPVVLSILYALWTLKYFRGFAFLLLASLTGLMFEIIGLKYGTVFGGHYVYQIDTQLMLFGVPILAPLYWIVFVYASYNIVSSFLFWINKEKPSKHTGGAILLPFLVFLDGLVVVAIDLFMEPLQVEAGNWIWLEGGPYFGIPIGNFIGWFIIATISTGIFRVFEYFSPQEHTKMDKSVFLIPVISYGMLCLAFLSFALEIQLTGLALIGFLAMFPIVIANLILFLNWKKGLGGK